MNQESHLDGQRRFCSFFVDGDRFAIDILAVREVHRPLGVTPVQHANRFVRGLVNLRGQIITVLDPAVRLGLPPREQTKASRLVIIKTNDELRERGLDLTTCDHLVALWCDAISDVVSPGPSGIEPASAAVADGDAGDLLQGVIQVEEDVVRIIAPAAMLRIDEESTAAA